MWPPSPGSRCVPPSWPSPARAASSCGTWTPRPSPPDPHPAAPRCCPTPGTAPSPAWRGHPAGSCCSRPHPWTRPCWCGMCPPRTASSCSGSGAVGSPSWRGPPMAAKSWQPPPPPCSKCGKLRCGRVRSGPPSKGAARRGVGALMAAGCSSQCWGSPSSTPCPSPNTGGTCRARWEVRKQLRSWQICQRPPSRRPMGRRGLEELCSPWRGTPPGSGWR